MLTSQKSWNGSVLDQIGVCCLIERFCFHYGRPEFNRFVVYWKEWRQRLVYLDGILPEPITMRLPKERASIRYSQPGVYSWVRGYRRWDYHLSKTSIDLRLWIKRRPRTYVWNRPKPLRYCSTETATHQSASLLSHIWLGATIDLAWHLEVWNHRHLRRLWEKRTSQQFHVDNRRP